MAAPRKPKATAGVRTGKSKAKTAISVAAATPKVAATQAVNGNGGSAAPSAEMIRLWAYEVFLARGSNGGGDELSDWLTAEREIMERFVPHN